MSRAHTTTSDPLASAFAPRGVAVIGASADPDKMGSVMARSLQNFPGPVVLVNERAPDPAAGLFSSVTQGAEARAASVDLAVLCVPAPVCADALERAAAAGVRGALVCAGGFAEAGPEGEKAQHHLLDVAQRHGIRLLGPNTSGFLAPARGLYATFVPGAQSITPGRVGVVAASGGVNHALAFLLAQAGHGVSLSVGLGNAVDIGTAEMVDHLARDPDVRAIAMHVESVQDGPRLLDAVRRASEVKPVVALVVGRSDVGNFARSHTGALATAWRTTRALLAQAGAVLVDDERQLVDAVGALSVTRLPATGDPGVALVTAQAGPGLVVMDDLRHHGVRMPALSEQTQHAVGRLLPPITFQSNPVDTGRPGESFPGVLQAVGGDPGVDLVAIYALTEPGAIDLATAVRDGQGPGAAPVAVAIGGTDDEVIPLRDKLLADVSVATSPTGLAGGVRALVTDSRLRHVRQSAGASVELADGVGDLVNATGEWTEHDAKTLLALIGITTPRRVVCDTEDEVAEALHTLRPPLAVKLLDANVVHKTEVGGVHLGIRVPVELTEAMRHLRAIGASRFLVEEMAPGGVDLLVGARRDPVFGPIALVGLGGTVAEALADVTLRAAPLSVQEARLMPDDLLGRALLHGWRSGPTVDADELGRVVSLLGQLLVEHRHLDEVEVNPLRLTSQGLIALDAVITTRSIDGQPDQ